MMCVRSPRVGWCVTAVTESDGQIAGPTKLASQWHGAHGVASLAACVCKSRSRTAMKPLVQTVASQLLMQRSHMLATLGFDQLELWRTPMLR